LEFRELDLIILVWKRNSLTFLVFLPCPARRFSYGLSVFMAANFFFLRCNLYVWSTSLRYVFEMMCPPAELVVTRQNYGRESLVNLRQMVVRFPFSPNTLRGENHSTSPFSTPGVTPFGAESEWQAVQVSTLTFFPSTLRRFEVNHLLRRIRQPSRFLWQTFLLYRASSPSPPFPPKDNNRTASLLPIAIGR